MKTEVANLLVSCELAIRLHATRLLKKWSQQQHVDIKIHNFT